LVAAFTESRLGSGGERARLAILVALALQVARSAGAQETIVIDPSGSVDHWLAAGTVARLPKSNSPSLGNLASGNIGWFDYAFSIPESGWRRLAVDGQPYVGRVELEIDPSPAVDVPVSPGALRAGDWVWLSAGTHRARVSATFWTGLPRISSLKLEPPKAQQIPFHVIRDRDRPVTALHDCQPIHVLAGGSMMSSSIRMTFSLSGTTMRTQVLSVARTQLPKRYSVAVPCDQAGDFIVSLVQAEESNPSAAPVTVRYSAFDTRPVLAALHPGALVLDIDATRRPPDFASGSTSVIRASAGVYRESSRNGTQPFIRKSTTSAPGWFAYRVSNLQPGEPYILDLEYPNDATRVFVAAYLDRLDASFSYPASVGVETGGVWPTGQGMAHRRFTFWPKSGDGRVVIYNMYDGRRAAVARVRIYEASSKETAAGLRGKDMRDVAIWYEEGLNFKALAGINPNEDVHAVATPVNRYLGLAQSSGASVIWPNVNVYTFQLYPSRYNLTFNDQDTDITAAFLLGAQRYGLKVVPELHPRADELIWPARRDEEFNERLLLSGDGSQHYDGPDGRALRPPFYNALSLDVRRWYINMVGELADRYKDYPALSGIALRISDWQNPALNNLVSLEWGYDALTVARFLKDSGVAAQGALAISGNAPDVARQRRAILTTRFRTEWERWRCEQIRDTLRDIVERVRKARSDLTVYVFLFSLGNEVKTSDAAALRGMGIDVSLLRKVDGLVLVDGRFGHGASEDSLPWQQALRVEPLGPNGTVVVGGGAANASILSPMRYLEITPDAAPRTRLGWPRQGDEPWISAASEPAGRLRLERYAKQVGLFDVYMLGDGGNGYVFDDADTCDFFSEFKSLPRRPFAPVAMGPRGLAVRRSGDMFYLVNLTVEPMSVRVNLGRNTDVSRVVNGKRIELEDGGFVSTLKPYELAVYRTGSATGQLLVSPVGDSGP
jgi:hypothetical protein